MRDQRIKVSSNAVKLVTILLLIPFCLVLTGFSPQSEIERLIQRLKDKNWRVRKEAVEALGEIEDPRAVTPLISVLVGKIDSLIPLNELIKKAGVDIGSLEDQGLITAIPSDKNTDVRRAAAEALGKIKDPRAVGPLLSAFKDEHPVVQREAADALGKIGEPAFEPLLSALKDENYEVRKWAAYALGELGDPRAVEPLISALKDKDWPVREQATTALGKLGDLRAVEPLISAFKDKHPVVQREAADVLGKIGEPAFEPLLSALKDEDWHVRRGAAEALGEIKDPRAVEPLLSALKDKNWRVRKEAVEALGEIKDPRAVEPLLSALKDEDLAVVAGAYRFFIERGEPDTEAVLTKALDKYGNKTMAEVFLNCGNAQLATAARKWASSHGYTIMSFPGGSGGPKWGSKR